MSSGFAEFNDATSKLRGIMVAGNGTFSGTFSADNINALSHINVRDGAVSVYLGFSFPSSVRTAAFAVPAQEHTSIADISIPIAVWSEGPSAGTPGTVRLYKNGSLLSSATIGLEAHVGFPQVVRFIDTNVVGTSYYQVELVNAAFRYRVRVGGGREAMYEWRSGYLSLDLIGTITVGFRKR